MHFLEVMASFHNLQKVNSDNTSLQAALVRLGKPGLVVTLVFQVQPEREDHLVKMDCLVSRDCQGCEAIQVSRDHQASQGLLDQQVPLALGEILVREEPQDKQAPLAHLDLEEILVFLGQVAHLGRRERPVPKAALVELEHLVSNF